MKKLLTLLLACCITASFTSCDEDLFAEKETCYLCGGVGACYICAGTKMCTVCYGKNCKLQFLP